MKLLLLILLIQSSFASTPCQEEFTNFISKYSDFPTWKKLSPSLSELRTKKDEELISSSSVDGFSVIVARKKHQSFFKFSNKENCQAQASMTAFDEESCGDHELMSFVHQHPKSLVYYWSPHMEISVQTLVLMEQLSKTYKIPLLIIHYGSNKLIKRSLASVGSKVQSKSYDGQVLLSEGGNIHFPGLFFIKDSQIVHFIPGAETLKEYEQHLDRWLK